MVSDLRNVLFIGLYNEVNTVKSSDALKFHDVDVVHNYIWSFLFLQFQLLSTVSYWSLSN